VGYQALDPESKGGGRHRKPDRHDLPCPLPPVHATRPGKECENGAWPADLIAIVQVVAPGIIEIHRELYQPKPEHSGVKIEVALRVSGDGGHVMDSHSIPSVYRGRSACPGPACSITHGESAGWLSSGPLQAHTPAPYCVDRAEHAGSYIGGEDCAG
jgi:hypothetical protein